MNELRVSRLSPRILVILLVCVILLSACSTSKNGNGTPSADENEALPPEKMQVTFLAISPNPFSERIEIRFSVGRRA